MKNDANVVPLTAGKTKPTAQSVARLPVALIQVRDKSAAGLKKSLQVLFENADDTLFTMADRAASNAEQNAFFEAMRDLRLKRKSIEQRFLHNLFEAFAELNQYRVNGPAALLDAVASDALSLVQNDELEESVAVDVMVSKVLSRDAKALSHLTQRINALVSQQVDDKLNPLGPQALCRGFINACTGFGVDIKVKLIVLKLFEKYVLADTQELYAQANDLLAAAGVLPDLKDPPRAQARTARSSSTAAQAVGPAAEGGEDLHNAQQVFGALQSLLSQVRGIALPQREIPSDAVPISSGDLMRLLSHLQRAPSAQSAEVADVDLRHQLDSLLSRASAKSGKTRVVGEVDEDVINLVSMLFEFILDDRSLPDSLKALIARMQIPMLKVAVLDKSFFSRGNHPARRLLNEIASAALGWNERDDEQRDDLFQRIEQVVQRLLNDFTDDTEIFDDLLAEFVAFTGAQRRRSELLEQRMRDAEEGRAKSELARREVEQALNDRLLGRTLPEVVVRLLQEAWSKVLMLVCLKHGTDSVQWRAALETMDDLVWSVESHEQPEERQRLLKLVPSLLKDLRHGMAEAALDPFVSSEFFSALEALHVQALQRKAPVVKPVAAEVAAVAPAEPVALEANTGIEAPLLELPVVEAPAPEPEPPAMVEVVEEIVLLAPGQSREVEPELTVPEDDESVAKVDSLAVGSWVEFIENDEHKVRCKLAAIIKVTGKYVFVNRTGMKVMEKTRMGLAVEFRRQSLRLIDDALLFDRALESVIGNLRRLKHG